MYQEILQELSSVVEVAVRERDEAIECLRQALAELAQLQKFFNTILLPEEQHVLHCNYPEAMKETNRLQNCSYSHFSGNSLPRFSPLDFVSNPSGNSSPAISDSGSYSSSSSQMGLVVQDRRDYETVVMEMMGGVLPENGKFVQAIIEAGQLLGSLLITGPVPKWRKDPIKVSAQRPVMSNNNRMGHSTTGNWNYSGVELGSEMLNRCFPCKKARFSLMS